MNSTHGFKKHAILHKRQDYVERVAASQSEHRPDDPLAKNFKCFKVVVDGEEHQPVLSETEMQEAKELLEKVEAVVSEAAVPTYQDQGNQRGRKPKKSKIDKIKKVSKKGKSKKNEKSKKKKNGGKKQKRTRGENKKDIATPESLAETAVESAPPPKRRARRGVKAPPQKSEQGAHGDEAGHGLGAGDAGNGSGDVPEGVTFPDDAVDVPEGFEGTTNGLYSNAYRRAKAAGKSAEDARAVSCSLIVAFLNIYI